MWLTSNLPPCRLQYKLNLSSIAIFEQSSDVPALLRAKAELEARCQVMQSQLQKLQGALETADTEKGLMEESIDTVIKSGDVGVLAGLRERLRAGTARMSPTRRMFRRKPSVFKPDVAPGQVSKLLNQNAKPERWEYS